jgi:glycosyltransferase involved in cell wall biosynthesis
VTTRIRIAVCTNRSPDAVAESLAAIATNCPDAPRALVTSGLGETEIAAHRTAARGWEVLSEPRVGLSLARNVALAWVQDEHDVLAFVDDDAIVDPGWGDAMQARWDTAPADVAVIGGPIRPRFDAPPPDWVSDAILPALTLLDRGPEERDLDPEVEAVYGANISFRAGPLRAIGGFDPELGHSGRRIYFAEENEAQRLLVARGFRVRYVPDAGVLHVIPPERLTRGSFVRRRYAFGKALGARGGRTRGVAARELVRSAAGALVARDGRKRMERIVRAAENAGAVYGSTRPRRIA